MKNKSIRNQILIHLANNKLSEKELFEKFRLPVDCYMEILKSLNTQRLISYKNVVGSIIESNYIYPDIIADLKLTELGSRYVEIINGKKTIPFDHKPERLDYFTFKNTSLYLPLFEQLSYSEFDQNYSRLAANTDIDARLFYYILTGNFIERNEIKKRDDVRQCLNWLEKHITAHKYFDEALTLFDNNRLERHLLDNLRFALEQFLKDVFSNEKPLEKQNKDVENYLKEKGVSSHIRIMYKSVFTQYYIYQNDSVKHNEGFSEFEVEFLIEITTSLMKLFLKFENESTYRTV